MQYLEPLHKLEPWKKHLFGSDSCLIATGDTSNKEKAPVKFNIWLKSRKSLNIILYIDGSQEVNQNNIPTGIRAGWVLNWVGSWHQK